MPNELKVKQGLIVDGSGSAVLEVNGNAGDLLTVYDQSEGILLSVRDSGANPLFEVSSSGDIYMPQLSSSAQNYILTYDLATGNVFYTASSNFVGGAGGSDTQIQFNQNGNISGNAGLKYIYASQSLEQGSSQTYVSTAYSGSITNGTASLLSSYGDIRTKFNGGSYPYAVYTKGTSVLISEVVSASYSGITNITTVFLGSTSINVANTTMLGTYMAFSGPNANRGQIWPLPSGDTTLSSSGSHAEGSKTFALGNYSHAEGIGTLAAGSGSHAEGFGTRAIGLYAHAEGLRTSAIGDQSHAEGRDTTADGFGSHAEGINTYAGQGAHAEGTDTIAYSGHAEGYGTIPSGSYQHVEGKFNIPYDTSASFIIGNGTDTNNRSNLVYTDQNTFQITGSLRVTGSMYIEGLNQTSQTNVLTYNSTSGQVFFTASSAIGGGGGGTGPISVTGSTLYSNTPSADLNFSLTYPNSIFFGSGSGVIISGSGANKSNLIFLGYQAGYSASANTTDSNFLGYQAGAYSFGYQSNFLGYQAGYSASLVLNSNFLGYQAGYFARAANNSNFLGVSAGYSASNAAQSNFLGTSAGSEATNAAQSNFIGASAGQSAINSSGSNFIGHTVGQYASSASFSVLIGFNVANYLNAGVRNEQISSNNIIIGTGISLPRNRRDSINLGGIIFATGSYSVSDGLTPFTGSANGKVGINVVTPTSTLHVSGTTNVTTIQGSGSSSPLFSIVGSQGELFTVTDSMSGSLFSVSDISGLSILDVRSDSTVLMGLYTAPALYTTIITGSLPIGTTVIYNLPTSSYNGAFYDYTATSGSVARVGQIMAIRSASIVSYNETTSSIGTTTSLVMGVSVSGGNMILSGSASTSGWTIKTIIRSI